MADQKISQLNSLTGANTASGDLLTIVDINDTTMGASGTNKKMTLTEFQAAPVSAGTANGVVFLNGSKVETSGSALTFDGTNFATTGTASAAKLIPTGGTATGNGMYLSATNTLGFSTNGVLNMLLDDSGDLIVGGTSALSPAAGRTDLTINGASIGAIISFGNGGVRRGYIWQDGTDLYLANQANGSAIFITNNVERMRLDASGNLGLGVTPSAWGGGYRAIDNLLYNSSYSNNGGVAGMACNAFHNGTNWIYKNTTTANRFESTVDSFRWFSAPSGTAGNVISFTQAMTLDASGNFGIGTASPFGRFHLRMATDVNALFRDAASVGLLSGTLIDNFNNAFGVTNPLYLRASQFIYGTDSGGSFTERMRLDASGNLGIGTSTFGTSAAGVLSLGTGTAPSSGPADTVQLFSVDRSAGNTIPAVRCEGSGVTGAGITNVTVTHKIAMQVNGTIYYLLATTNAT